MEFTMKIISLKEPGPISGCNQYREYDEELDAINSILMDLCECLQDSELIRFVVSGFGEDWPVDVATDLEIVLEQLPEARDCAERGQKFVIGFYEQGIERTLIFEPDAEHFVAHCVSELSEPTSWPPDSKALRLPQDEVKTMLEDLARDFCRVASIACPALTRHPWFGEWQRSVLDWQP